MTTQWVGRIAVEVDGDGDAAILIHGLGGTSNVWGPVLPAVARHRAVRFDLPGSGRSSPGDGPLSISGFVDAVQRAARAVGIERAHVIGHSLGAIIAFHLAAREPRLVRSLALYGPLLAPPDSARAGLKARADRVRRDGMPAVVDTLVEASTAAETRARRPVAAAFVRELLMRQSADGYARSCDALADAQPAELSGILCPTLLVTGDEDAIAPPQAVRQISERMQSARVETLSRCGHWAMIEKPDESKDLLQRFLNQRI